MRRKLSIRNTELWVWLRGCASVLVVLAVAALVFVIVAVQGLGTSAHEALVPDVVGEPEADAMATLAKAELEGHVTAHNYHEEVPYGHVISTEPPALMRVRAGRRVQMVVSSGPRKIKTPRVIELASEDAQRILEKAGLTVGRITRRHSDQPSDRVLSQNPKPGEKLRRGEAIDLVVSGGSDFGQFEDADGQTVLLRRVRIVVPAGRTVQRVRVTLNYRHGVKTLYDRIHRKGDEILVDFQASTGDRVHVYIDEKLAERKRL